MAGVYTLSVGCWLGALLVALLTKSTFSRRVPLLGLCMPDRARRSLDLAGHGYLLYDGDCGVCQSLADYARKIDRRQHFSVEPYQNFAEAELRLHGISYADCERGIQVVTQSGRVSRGAFALNRFLIGYFPWSLAVVLLYVLPPLLVLELIAYRQFARHRQHVSRWLGLTVCKVPAARH